MPSLITKEKFMETYENNELNLDSKQLARLMGISLPYFYKIRKECRRLIRDKAGDIAQGMALNMVMNLKKNADNGDTQAAVRLLEIGGTYIPASKQKLEIDAENLGVIVLPEKKPLGAPVDPALLNRPEHKMIGG